MNSDGSWWQVKHYTVHFIMLQRAIPWPLNEIWWLYETSHNLRQYSVLCVVYHGSMSDASGLASSAVYYCMLMSWALLYCALCNLIYCALCNLVSADNYIVAYGLVNILNIHHSHAHDQSLTMLCTPGMFYRMSIYASYILCSILPYGMGISALCHGHCFILLYAV